MSKTQEIPWWQQEMEDGPRPKANIKLPDPPGFKPFKASKKSKDLTRDNERPVGPTADTDTLKLKKSWELALAPAKSLPMNGIMMYMSGNSLQIFSIMMVFMLFKTPLTGLMHTNQVFERFETKGNKKALLLPKLCYIIMQVLALGLGIWKVNGMGLLPTTTSDWLAYETAAEPAGRVYFAYD